MYTPEFSGKEERKVKAEELQFNAGQSLHAKVNKHDLNKEGGLFSSGTLERIKAYHRERPEIKKLDKHDPNVRALFEKSETPRSIIFVEDEMYVLYRDFSRDILNLSLLFEKELPKNLEELSKDKLPCIVVDENKRFLYFINKQHKKIILTGSELTGLDDLIKENIEKDINARKIVLASPNAIFERLKNAGFTKGNVQKGSQILSEGRGDRSLGVKLALNVRTKKWVAVKKFSFDSDNSAEEDALRSLKELLGTVTINKKRYCIIELHNGMTLDDFLKENPIIIDNKDPMKTIKETLALMLALAKELQRIHEQGFIHKDLHGGNILVEPEKLDVHLIDFGLSKKIKNLADGKIRQDTNVFIQILLVLAERLETALMPELLKEENKNLFLCLLALPDAETDLSPYILRMTNVLKGQEVQFPKDDIDELEATRNAFIKQNNMTPKNFNVLMIQTKEKKSDAYPGIEKDIEKHIKREKALIKRSTINIDIDKPITTEGEKAKFEKEKDRVLDEFVKIKSHTLVEHLGSDILGRMLAKYQIIEMCDRRIQEFSTLLTDDQKPKRT